MPVLETPDAPETPEAPPQIGDTRPAPTPVAEEPPPEGDTPDESRVPTAYERKLRAENADYRQKWQQYEQALGEYPPEVQNAILHLAGRVGEDPSAAVVELAQALGLVDPNDFAEPDPDVMTRAEFQAWQEEQQAAAEDEESVAWLQQEAAQFGVEPGTPAYNSLLGLLENDETLTVEEGVKMLFQGLDEFQKQTISDYLAGKTSSPAPAMQGSAPSGEVDIANADDPMKAARAATIARLGG